MRTLMSPIRRTGLLTLLTCTVIGVLARHEAKGGGLLSHNEPRRNAIAATVRILGGMVVTPGEFSKQSTASGVIISAQGHVLTNYHVISGPGGQLFPELWAGLVDPDTSYLPPNRVLRLRVLKADPASDLALLQLDSRGQAFSFPFLNLTPQTDLRYGSTLTLIGFPAAGGPTTTVVSSSVVGFDFQNGWIKVDGGMLQGSSGGAAIDAAGYLVGIPTRVVTDEPPVPIFDYWQEVPVGTIQLGHVGYLRSADAIRRFLAGVSPQDTGIPPPPPPPPALAPGGTVTDLKTGQRIPGVAVAILSRSTPDPVQGITSSDLLAYAMTDAKGEFTVNRALLPGTYIAKFVHTAYQPLLQPFDLKPGQARFSVTLKREP